MNLQKQARAKAAEFGAVICRENLPEFRETVLEAEAPDGLQWTASGSYLLIARYWSYIPGSKDEAYHDLIQRMSKGLEPLDHEL